MSETKLTKAQERARQRVDTIRFSVLATSIAVSIAAVMMVDPVVQDRIPLQFVISIPLLAGLYVVSRSVRILAFGLVVTVLAMFLGVRSIVRQEDDLLILDVALRATFLAVTAAWVAREVARERVVSVDTILGGISVYLLLGFTFALFYAGVLVAVPNAFNSSAGPLPEPFTGHHSFASLPSVLYFSFSTLTTVAFGDITPVAPVARLASMAEGMIGQLFPAVFIARLVGMHIAQRSAPRSGS